MRSLSGMPGPISHIGGRVRAGAALSKRVHVIETGRATHGSTWASYGHLLRLAGDEAGARAAYARALDMLDERHGRRAIFDIRYLLGERLPRGEDGFFERTLRALAAGDFEVREAVVLTIRASQVLPDYTAPDLTLYDVLEETFPDITSRSEIPSAAACCAPGPPRRRPTSRPATRLSPR